MAGKERNIDEPLKQIDIPLTGKLVTSRDSLLLKEGDFSVLTNMRYTDTNPKSIGGMQLVNTNPSASVDVTASFQFIKNQPEETHNLYQKKTYIANILINSLLREVTAPIIGSTVASLTESTLLTDGADALNSEAQFSSAPNNSMIYCNEDTSYIWLGTRNTVGKIVNASDNYEDMTAFAYDYTERLNSNNSDNCLLVEDAGAVYLYIMTTNIACGFWFTIGVANTTVSTATVSYYNTTTAAWVAVSGFYDGTKYSPSGASLAQNGDMTFTQPTQYPTVFNGINGYWYKVVISATPGTTTLNRVYGKYNIQPMHNLWDGKEATCLSFLKFDSVNGKYTDHTTNIAKVDFQEVGTSKYVHTYCNLNGTSSADKFYFGFQDRTTAINVAIADTNSAEANVTLTFEYWNGSTWVGVGGFFDGTFDNGGAFNKSGRISWKSPVIGSEYKRSLNSGPALYYYRMNTSGSIADSCYIDYLSGIPTYEDLDSYKTCTLWKNRVVLGNNFNIDANELNIGASNTNCVFNGTDSITLYIDDPQPIQKIGTIASKYSSGIVDTLLVLKKNQTYIIEGTNPDDYKVVKVSDKHGIIAHRTFSTCEYNDQQGGYRSCAVWLSSNGMVMYDGGIVRPIDMDIEDIFREQHNTSYTTRINPSYSYQSVGWYDSLNREYHLVFDLERLKWYKIDRGTLDIAYGAQFVDTNSIPIQYGFLGGYFYRLDHGTSFNGTAITSTMRLADKPFTKSLSQEATVRYVRLVGKAVSVTTGTPVITFTHYGDGITVGTDMGSKSAANSGYRLYHNIWQTNKKNNIHGYEFIFSNAYNEHHFEPLIMSVLYKGDRIDVRD
jgi:hypothetical protein